MISLIITVYNKEIYLGHCFSLLREQLLKLDEQTRDKFEILVIDDCSTDNSIDLIRDIFSNDIKYRLIQNEERRNIAHVRWQALNEVRGDYFIFIDADDLINESYIDILLNIDLNENFDLYQFKGRQYPAGYIMDFDSTWMPLKLIKTSFIRDNNLNFNRGLEPCINEDGDIAVVAEDLEFFERFNECKPSIKNIDKILVTWNYAVPNSLTKVYFPFTEHMIPKK